MRPKALAICLLSLALGFGCATPGSTRATAAPDVTKPKKRRVDAEWHWFVNTFLRPTKELLYVQRWWGRLCGSPIEATNTDRDGNPVGSVVFVNRDIAKMSAADMARGPNTDNGPVGKITVGKIKTSGATPGFFGQDSRGVKYLFKFDIPGWPVEEIDPTGAGDCFSAAFIAGLEAGWPLENVGRFANAAGALAVTKMGPMEGASSINQVNAFLTAEIA